MRIVLHIGAPKTGTTALQKSLRQNRDLLWKHRVYYPPFGGKSASHLILSSASRSAKRLPRQVEQSFDEVQLAFKDFMITLRKKVLDYKPDTLVLSTEGLFNTKDREKTASLLCKLREFGDEILTVAYVRNPGDRYLSNAQQKIRASYELPLVSELTYKKNLCDFMELSDAILVREFSRAKLVKQDITSDFLTHAFPQNAELPAISTQLKANETMSAEAIDIIQDYRRIFFADRDDKHTPESRSYVKAVRILDCELDGFRRPVLLDHIRESVISHCRDLDWLKNEHGIVFDGVNYENLTERPAKVWRPSHVNEICLFDPERRDRLKHAIEAHVGS